jgi:hypothetical protein
MFPYWLKKLFPKKSRPAARRRQARAQLGLEQLEAREVPTVFAGISGGTLLVHSDRFDGVGIDHVVNSGGAFTEVSSVSGTFLFRDSAITNGIHLQGGFHDISILATVKPLTSDSNDSSFVFLGNGNMQGITAPVSLGANQNVTLDDRNDPTGQNVTMNASPGGIFSAGTITVAGLARFATISFNTDSLGFTEYFVRGGTGHNTFNILNTIGLVADLNTGLGSDTVNVLGTSATRLSIEGFNGFDTINIGNNGSLQGIQSLVLVNTAGGGGKFANLFVDGSNETSQQNVVMGVAPGGDPSVFLIGGLLPAGNVIEYSAPHTSFVNVKGGQPNLPDELPNIFTVNETIPNGSTQIDTGAAEAQVFVKGTLGQLFISNGRPSTINVGNNHSLLTIQGAIHISNPPSRSTLTVDGSADNFTRTFDLSATSTLGLIEGLGGGAPIFYVPNDLSQIHLIGGQGNETYLVRSTAGIAPVTIDGLGRTATFTVGNFNNALDDIHTTLNLNGGAGFDTLTVNDQGSTTGHFYSDNGHQITRDFGAVTINYALMNLHTLNRSPLPPHFIPDPGFPAAADLALTDSIRAGQRATLSGQLTDADPREVLSLSVDWGDGSNPVQRTPDRAPFHLSHRYETPGTYKVVVTWTDSFGRSNSRDLTLTVQPAGHGEHGDGESVAHDADAVSRLDAVFALLGSGDGHHDG